MSFFPWNLPLTSMEANLLLPTYTMDANLLTPTCMEVFKQVNLLPWKQFFFHGNFQWQLVENFKGMLEVRYTYTRVTF